MDGAERPDDTAQVVLDAVCRQLWSADEGMLRIAEVCADTELSSSVIYNHFRSRQGLIDAAYLEIYRHMTADLLALVTRLLADVTTNEELRHVILSQSEDPERHRSWMRGRHMRLRITTAALARESLQSQFGPLQQRYLDGLAALFVDLQQRGVVGDLLTPRQLALAFEGCLLFHSFNDIALRPVDNASWVQIFMTMMGSPEPTTSTATLAASS